MNHPKQFVNNFASIDLIIGPMYGGKTTELLRRLVVCKEMGLRCCYINSSSDSRTQTAYSTHNKLLANASSAKSTGNLLGDTDDFIAAVKIDEISDLLTMIDDYDVFGIDEAQLFTNLLSTTTQLADIHHKRIIVAGLNGTSERRVFGEILYLIPHANTIQKLEPFCKLCAENSKITPAIFTKCTVSKSSTIMIGGKDSYVAVCRECYNDTDSSTANSPTVQIYQSVPSSDPIYSSDESSATLTSDSNDPDATGAVNNTDSSDADSSDVDSSDARPLLPRAPSSCVDESDTDSA
jgi:thymidine kinase